MADTTLKPENSNKISQGKVFYPTIETSEPKELSPYLDRLVKENVILPKTAAVLNHLSDPWLQKEASKRFLEGQRLLVWQIVQDLLNPFSEKSSANRMPLDTRPPWKTKVLHWGIGIVAAAGVLSLVLLSINGVLERSHRSAAVTQQAGNQASFSHPPLHPSVAAKPVAKSKPPTTLVQINPPPPSSESEGSVPTHLEVQSLSAHEALVAWSNLGRGYSFTVYLANDPAMNDPQIIRAKIPTNTFWFHREGRNHRTYWLAVTATDIHGSTGPMSESLSVRL